MDIQTRLLDAQTLDWALGPLGLSADDSLTTSVLIALLTDARVDGQRGWWGDSYPETSAPERRTAASRLWLLDRAKQTPQTLRDARIYAEEALQWLVQDGTAASVTVTPSYPARGVLQLIIVIVRGQTGSGTEQIRIDNLWSLYAV